MVLKFNVVNSDGQSKEVLLEFTDEELDAFVGDLAKAHEVCIHFLNVNMFLEGESQQSSSSGGICSFDCGYSFGDGNNDNYNDNNKGNLIIMIIVVNSSSSSSSSRSSRRVQLMIVVVVLLAVGNVGLIYHVSLLMSRYLRS